MNDLGQLDIHIEKKNKVDPYFTLKRKHFKVEFRCPCERQNTKAFRRQCRKISLLPQDRIIVFKQDNHIQKYW